MKSRLTCLSVHRILFNNNLVPLIQLDRMIIKIKVRVSIDGVGKEKSISGRSVHPDTRDSVPVFPRVPTGSVPFEDQDVGPTPTSVPAYQRVDLQIKTDSEQGAPAGNCPY